MFKRLIPIRTGGAIQLWIGNAPVTNGWLDEKAFSVHPFVNGAERHRLLTIGEPAYNHLALKRFTAGFLANPPAYFVNCLRRTMYLLVGKPTQLPQEHRFFLNREWKGVFWDSLLLNASFTFLGISGLLAAYRSRDSLKPIPLLAVSVMVPFIATGVIDRYSLPLRWLLIVFGGARLWMVFRTHRHKVPASGIKFRAT